MPTVLLRSPDGRVPPMGGLAASNEAGGQKRVICRIANPAPGAPGSSTELHRSGPMATGMATAIGAKRHKAQARG